MKEKHILLTKVTKTAEKFALFPQNQDPDRIGTSGLPMDNAGLRARTKCLIALSGGADSCALFYALLALKDEFNVECFCVHVNHKIRSGEAQRDADFVKRICEQEQVPLFYEEADVPALARQQKNSLETQARIVRYACYARIAEEHDMDRIATAHTQNDNSETMLLRLVRGAGPDGLCGIPPKRGKIIRPLIEVRRQEVEEYLSAIGKSYVTDSTNADLAYPRNLIRHEVLPRLRKLNENLDETLLRTASILREERAYLNAICDTIPEQASPGDIAGLAPPVLARHLVRRYESAGGKGVLESVHLFALERMIREAAADVTGRTKYLAVPGGLTAEISKHRLVFRPTAARQTGQICEDSSCRDARNANGLRLQLGIHVRWDDSTLLLLTNEQNSDPTIGIDKIIYKLSNKISLLSDKISGNLFVRTRRAGDTIKIGGMTKSVKKLLNEKRIPLEQRDTLAFLCDDSGILWIPGLAVCDMHRPALTHPPACHLIYFYEYRAMTAQ